MRRARQSITSFVTKFKISVFIVALTATSLLPMLANPEIAHAICGITCTYSDPWGTQEVASSGWLTAIGGGVPIYSNGPLAPNGPSPDTYNYVNNINNVNTQTGIEWQCVELVNRLYITKGWITSTWTGNGNQLYANAPSNLTKQANGSITNLAVGDVISMSNGSGPGHAAIVNSISGSAITIASQNTNAVYDSTSFTISNGTISTTWSNYSVIGVIHAPTNPGLGGGNGSTWASGRVDAWIEQASPTNGSNLGHVWYDQNGWNPWETIPASNELMASQPAAVSWGLNRIDVFAQGQAGDLIHTWYDGTKWYSWETLGGCIEGPPTVTSWGANRLDVFAEGCNTTGGNLWHTFYDTSGWHSWENIETSLVMTAPPSAVSWASGRIDVFSRGTDSSLVHTFYDGAWESWGSLGGCILGSPAASSWGPNRLDVFVEGCNTTGGNFYHVFWNGQWNPFEPVNSSYQVAGVLGAVSWGSQRIDMFTRRSDNTLDHWWYDQNGWNGPDNRGGALAS